MNGIISRLNDTLNADTVHTSHTSAGTDDPCWCPVRFDHFEDDTIS